MKKILMSLLWIALYLNPLQAQIKQGSWLVGGNGSLSQTRFFDKIGQFDNSFKFENLYLNPELGYFITNHWLLGARAGVSFLTTSFTDINGQPKRQTSYESASVEPFTRIYWNPQHRFKIFYELSAGSFWAKNNNVVLALDSLRRQSSFSISNMVGVNYFLTDNIAIEGFIHYNLYNKSKNPNRTTETSFPKFIFNPTFRMRLFLNTKDKTTEWAQKYFEKGSFTYGVRMNLLFHGSNGFNASSFTPSIGYFVMDRLMIGSEFSISYASNSVFGLHLMPEVRYYQPLSHLTQGFGRMLFRTTYSMDNLNGFTSKFRRQELEAGVGVNRFLAPNISVQSSLNVSLSIHNLSSSTEFKPNLRIGFQYFMSKK